MKSRCGHKNKNDSAGQRNIWAINILCIWIFGAFSSFSIDVLAVAFWLSIMWVLIYWSELEHERRMHNCD